MFEEEKSENTVQAYLYNVKFLLNFISMKQEIEEYNEEIKESDIEDLISFYKMKGNSSTSINLKLCSIASFMRCLKKGRSLKAILEMPSIIYVTKYQPPQNLTYLLNQKLKARKVVLDNNNYQHKIIFSLLVAGLKPQRTVEIKFMDIINTKHTEV